MFFRLLYFASVFLLCSTRMPTGYSEYYAKYKLAPIAGAFGSGEQSVKNHLSGCFYNATLYSYQLQICDMFNASDPNITCAGYIFASHDDQAIVLALRYSTNDPEVNQQLDFWNTTVQFPGGGTVHKFYYNGFMVLWNAGLRDGFFAAKNAFPTYELWVTGVSLGGALSSIAAPYITQMGYFDKANLKLVNFGAVRVGYPDFVNRYPSLITYAYRVTHRDDIVPHLFQLNGYLNYANEIWYNNTMTTGEPYIECDTVESANCSNSVPEKAWTWGDHNYFSGVGCMKFTNPPSE